MEHTAPLPEWTMYAILAIQGIVYTGAVWKMGKSKGSSASSFLSGGRNIGHGMINASVVATWIWAATLMISSWTGYRWGFVGPWWYALGATVPLPIMAFMGRRIKEVMPKVTSYPEFVKFRTDDKNHLLHSIITIIVCFWVTLMIITGGAVMGNSFTGAPFWLISLIMVIIFVSYVSFAGLWASIFADTIMSLVMYACLMVICWTVVLKIGPNAIYDGLVEVMEKQPYLATDMSRAEAAGQWDPLNWFNSRGLGFLIVNTIGNLGAVMCNQTYWSRVTGSGSPQIVFRSFMSAAFCWWPIPFATATALGVTGLAKQLVVGEVYQVGEATMRFTESSAVAPMTAFLVLGFIGLALFIIAVGGATISTGAGEIMAVVTVVVNDIFKGHINPDAKDKQLLFHSRLWLFITAAALLAIVIWWRIIGFSFGGMYEAMGIAFSSAVIPLIMMVFWSKTNTNGVFWGTIIGALCGIYYWVVVANFDLMWGVVWGNIIVMTVSFIIAVPWTLIRPQPFDYGELKDKAFEYEDVDSLLTVDKDVVDE